MTNQERATFGSKLGVILASVGSAVGLGNIWRFPYEAGQNGGAAFLLVYIGCVLLLGLPVMLTEFFIGRHSKSNAFGAFNVLAPGTRWNLIGIMFVIAAFFILGFYSVISGWTLEYLWQSLSNSLGHQSTAEYASEFTAFTSHNFRPLIWTMVFLLLTHFIISAGVQKGIERASKIMMPLLFIFITILAIRSIMLPNGMEGLKFLFQPDFSKINSKVIISALGQAFFSLSIGMGTLITYSSYFSSDTKLVKTALSVITLDTLVAVMAGVIIFPAVFSFGIAPSQGTELVFITLPNVFQQMPFSIFWATIFYLLLAVAALTSTISMHEVATAFVNEELKIDRKKAAWFVTGIVMVLGVLSTLSFGILKENTIFGLTVFELLDFVTAKVMLPIGGMLICYFVGWRIDKKVLKAELTNNGTAPFYFFNGFSFVLRYIAPAAIALIFLNELGAFKFFQS